MKQSCVWAWDNAHRASAHNRIYLWGMQGPLASMLSNVFSKCVLPLQQKQKYTCACRATTVPKKRHNWDPGWGISTLAAVQVELRGEEECKSCHVESGGSGNPGTKEIAQLPMDWQVCLHLGKWQQPLLTAHVSLNNYLKQARLRIRSEAKKTNVLIKFFKSTVTWARLWCGS